MTCPKCQGRMRQYERSGVTVDQCTECRGIFLDRGELEHLVDAETSWHGGGPQYQPSRRAPARGYANHDEDSDEYPIVGGQPRRRKRRGFLEELFD